jgi:hypothetical protein
LVGSLVLLLVDTFLFFDAPEMESIKFTGFGRDRRELNVCKKRFHAVGLMQRDDFATTQQQVALDSLLTLAISEDVLSTIENVSQADQKCGLAAWTMLVDHYEDDGTYRIAELLQNLETP